MLNNDSSACSQLPSCVAALVKNNPLRRLLLGGVLGAALHVVTRVESAWFQRLEHDIV